MPIDLERSAIDPAVRQLIDHHAAGQHSGFVCPICGGGPQRERSFAFFISSSGAVRYICHRASCGVRGGYSTGLPDIHAPKVEAPTERPYMRPIHPLSDESREFFTIRYGIPPSQQNIYESDGRYILPIFNSFGVRRGLISRRPYPGSPLAALDSDLTLPKALTYWEHPGPMQSWYFTRDGQGQKHGHVILVEDQLSAMRIMSYLAECDRDAELAVCALLGTGVNQERIGEIQSIVARDGLVEFALDSDATGQAFAHARKWGSAFNKCIVRVLSKDFKDMTNEEIAQYFV